MMISFDKSVKTVPESDLFGIPRNHQNVSADEKIPVELVKRGGCLPGLARYNYLHGRPAAGAKKFIFFGVY